jgi:hypothetical protein
MKPMMLTLRSASHTVTVNLEVRGGVVFTASEDGHPFTEADLPSSCRGAEARLRAEVLPEEADGLAGVVADIVRLLYGFGALSVHTDWCEPSAQPGDQAVAPPYVLAVAQERCPGLTLEPRPVAPASAVESLIELYAERLNKIGSQADLDRLRAEIEHSAKTLAPEELLAYAAAPNLRGQLLSLCVDARAQERAAAPRGSATGDPSPPRAPAATRGPSPWDPYPDHEGAERAA